MSYSEIVKQRERRASTIKECGGLEEALFSGRLEGYTDLTLSEAIVLGLLKQDVREYIGILGHGSTEVAEVIRVYQDAGLVRMTAVRHETEAVHAATALRWVTGKKSAVITSIGPGALHALAGSLAPLSDGIGVWFLLADETTEDEGPNMQQIPGHDQNRFHRLFSAMGETYSLYTPGSISTALSRGLTATDHPFRQSPFFLLMPMNTQPAIMPGFNLAELPESVVPEIKTSPSRHDLAAAVDAIEKAEKVVVKIGGGAVMLGDELISFLELADGVAVSSPIAAGVVPFSHQRNMTVGGSKGTLSGNFAMEEADLLVALGTRFVCQSDCSRTGYPRVEMVININTDLNTVLHYRKTIPLPGDVKSVLKELNRLLEAGKPAEEESHWLKTCIEKRKEWDAFREARYQQETLYDPMWKSDVLTQPAAIKAASDWALRNEIPMFFDAGDVQANGFQIVEADKPGQVYTETGASYMGFAASALLSTALADKPFYGLAFSGDGSFMMNPQILIDGVEHGARGCILLMDNRRMGAISGLQKDQYGKPFATWDGVEVDYLALAGAVKGMAVFDGGLSVASLTKALEAAKKHEGLSLVYLKTYYGDDPLGGMGVFGRWNVGNWTEKTQTLRHRIGL